MFCWKDFSVEIGFKLNCQFTLGMILFIGRCWRDMKKEFKLICIKKVSKTRNLLDSDNLEISIQICLERGRKKLTEMIDKCKITASDKGGCERQNIKTEVWQEKTLLNQQLV